MTIRLDDLEVPDATIDVRWASVGADRRLTVRADGSAWWWSLAGTGRGADEVGTWRCEPDRETLDAVADLARSVTTAPRGGDDRLGFTVTAGSVHEWVAEGTERAGRLLAALAPLVTTLRAAPLAVARWTVTVGRPPTGEQLAGFSVTATGPRSVTLLIDAAGLELTSPDGTTSALPPLRMGLVTADVDLLDGLYQPAVLAPGRSGTCVVVLPGETPTETAGLDTGGGSGTVTGSIGLPGPWASSGSGAPEPLLTFRARAPVHAGP